VADSDQSSLPVRRGPHRMDRLARPTVAALRALHRKRAYPKLSKRRSTWPSAHTSTQRHHPKSIICRAFPGTARRGIGSKRNGRSQQRDCVPLSRMHLPRAQRCNAEGWTAQGCTAAGRNATRTVACRTVARASVVYTGASALYMRASALYIGSSALYIGARAPHLLECDRDIRALRVEGPLALILRH
jgi:hypothetical protein